MVVGVYFAVIIIIIIINYEMNLPDFNQPQEKGKDEDRPCDQNCPEKNTPKLGVMWTQAALRGQNPERYGSVS